MRYLLPLLLICAMPAVASASIIKEFTWDLTTADGPDNFGDVLTFTQGDFVLTAEGFVRSGGVDTVTQLFTGADGLGVNSENDATDGSDGDGSSIDYFAADDSFEFIRFTISGPNNYTGWQTGQGITIVKTADVASFIDTEVTGTKALDDGFNDLSEFGATRNFVLAADDIEFGDSSFGKFSLQSLDGSSVPEPVSTSLFGALGLAGFFGYRRRKNNKAEESKEELAA